MIPLRYVILQEFGVDMQQMFYQSDTVGRTTQRFFGQKRYSPSLLHREYAYDYERTQSSEKTQQCQKMGTPESFRATRRKKKKVLMYSFRDRFPFRTAFPHWGYITYNLTGLSPEQGCSLERDISLKPTADRGTSSDARHKKISRLL